MKDWKRAVVHPDASIIAALEAIDNSALQIALITDSDRRLLGVVTDGDVRKHLLLKKSLNMPVSEIMNPTPLTAAADEDRSILVGQMRARGCHQIPLIGADGKLAGLATIDDLILSEDRPNLVLLMAGGFGTRLRPLTDNCPKPMLKVGHRPILETTLLQFVEHGFRNFAISVHYLADQIIDYFGDGSRFNVAIEYLTEKEPMGTGGALALLKERPSAPFFLMNGDLLTRLNFRSLLDFHQERGVAMTVCAREYTHTVPFGVIDAQDGLVGNVIEKPVHRFLVNAGIYVCDPEVLDFVEPGAFTNATDIANRLAERGRKPAVFPIHEYWLDIGQQADFARAAEEFSDVFLG